MLIEKLKQFVPSKVCLACDGCCRFRDKKSCWRPKVTEEEKTAVSQSDKNFSRAVDAGQVLRTIPWQGRHICYFFHPAHNTCGIYALRPFECQLYPFALVGNKTSISVNVHLACPYIQEKRNTPDFERYLVELKIFFSQKSTQRFLQKYLSLDHSYFGHEQEFEELFPLDGIS